MIKRYFYIIIPIFAFLTYFPIINNDFVYCDDHDIVLKNSERINSISNIFDEFEKGYIGTNYYRPMIYISFIIDYALGGKNPMNYQITNIILHSIMGVLLYIFLVKLKILELHSFLIAILFIAHPLFNNAVAWVVGRNDIIWGIFVLLSFIYFINYRNTKKLVHLVIHSFGLLLAFLSKETALVFPAVLFLYFILQEKFDFKKLMPIGISWIISYLIYFLLKSNAELGSSVNNFGVEHILTNWRIPIEYIGKFFLPFDLMVLSTLSLTYTAIGLFCFGILIYFIFKKYKENSNIILGFLWFGITTVPFLFFNLLNSNDWNEYLECRSYVPMIGIFIVLLSIIPKKYLNLDKNYSKSIYVLILGVFLFFNYNESFNYKNPITFYESAIEDDPDKALFHFVLSRHYRAKGDRINEEKSLLNSYKANNTYSKYPYNIGVFYFKNEEYNKAIDYLNKAYFLDSNDSDITLSLGKSYLAAGKFDSATAIMNNQFNELGYDKDLIYSLINVNLVIKNYSEAKKFLVLAQQNNDYQKQIADLLYITYKKLQSENDSLGIRVLKDFRQYVNRK